jgi:hypothetical protein
VTIVPESDPGPPTLAPTLPDLIARGILDAELAGLAWLLVEGGVPLVIGGMDAATRTEVARAVLGIDPSRPWVLLDVEARPPTLDELAALLRGGTAVGLSVDAPDLRGIVDRLEAGPAHLPDDAVRRLGTVFVLAARLPGPRVVAAHYLRPTERDGGGHLQRRPPAVLATWDGDGDAFEHFAWGVTPELGDRVGRSQADLEDRQRDRAAFLARVVAGASGAPRALGDLVRDHLASEPPREPPSERPAATPSPFSGGLIDPEPHVH